tara:strand:- start:2346 stop:2546 length:201 start_codon:yes stop_codon:yes gene_type:complete
MKNKFKKDWDRFDKEHYEKVKKSRAKTATFTVRLTEQEKQDYMKNVENPSELLRDFMIYKGQTKNK